MASANTNLPNTSLPFINRIAELRAPYAGSGSCFHNIADLIVQKPSKITTNGFMGSDRSVSLICPQGVVTYDSPGCIAAPKVHMMAQQRIKLGTHDTAPNNPYSPDRRPLGIYAPDVLTIQAPHVIVGNVRFLDPLPLTGELLCSTLSIINFSQDSTLLLSSILPTWLKQPTWVEVIEPAQLPMQMQSLN